MTSSSFLKENASSGLATFVGELAKNLLEICFEQEPNEKASKRKTARQRWLLVR